MKTEKTFIPTIAKDKSYAEKVAKNHWLTPEITDILDKIIRERWIVREVIYSKEVPECEIFDYNGCMRLYHNADRFFALEGEKLNSEAGKYCNLNADFMSAERIIIQQRDDEAFDHWQGEPFELTSLWPKRQLVIAVKHTNNQLIALAPIFAAYTPKFSCTNDMEKFFEFEKEFNVYRNHIERSFSKTISPKTLLFLQNSYKLLVWLKNHCH